MLPDLDYVNNIAMDVDVRISLQNPIFNFFGYVPRSGVAGSYGSSILIF